MRSFLEKVRFHKITDDTLTPVTGKILSEGELVKKYHGGGKMSPEKVSQKLQKLAGNHNEAEDLLAEAITDYQGLLEADGAENILGKERIEKAQENSRTQIEECFAKVNQTNDVLPSSLRDRHFRSRILP